MDIYFLIEIRWLRHLSLNLRQTTQAMVEAINYKKERKTVAEWLELESISLKMGNTSYAYLKVLKDGLTFRSVKSFTDYSTLSRGQVSNLIHVSERTLQRNAPNKIMDINSSERLLQLTRLFLKGIDVFNDDKEKFISWINRPNKSLAYSKPIELMETTLGIGLVFDELLRIEHGVFS